jgi:Pseudouridylate synthases, 23S RNA-specific
MVDNLISYDNKKKIIQKAISYMSVIKSSSDHTLVELNPITGRKHQLRKQLFNIGNPIVGDDKYFLNKKFMNLSGEKGKLMLHAYKIKFIINNIKYSFKSKLMIKILSLFLKKRFLILL